MIQITVAKLMPKKGQYLIDERGWGMEARNGEICLLRDGVNKGSHYED